MLQNLPQVPFVSEKRTSIENWFQGNCPGGFAIQLSSWVSVSAIEKVKKNADMINLYSDSDKELEDGGSIEAEVGMFMMLKKQDPSTVLLDWWFGNRYY